jgi:hypothetical protein
MVFLGLEFFPGAAFFVWWISGTESLSFGFLFFFWMPVPDFLCSVFEQALPLISSLLLHHLQVNIDTYS